jgi:peptide/nickel transport system substrate-binding protein
MRATRAIAVAAAAMLAVGLGLAACNIGSETHSGRRDPGTLIVAQPADVLALDPVRVTDSESIEVGELLFEGLVHLAPGTTDVAPALATSWEVSPDARRWTFHLRSGVIFHDGTPLDAAAVAFSFTRLIDPKSGGYVGAGADYWRELLRDVQSVTARDAETVEIVMARPYAPLLGELAQFPIVSPTAVAKWGDAFQQHPVGSGPYAFDSWEVGEQVVVRRFDGYWGAKPALERIVFRVVVDARQRLIDLESGSVDLATAILPDEHSFVELHPDLVLHRAPGDDVSYLAFNTQRAPFDDVRVRRALNFAINKEPIVKLAFQGLAIAADGPLPPAMWGSHKAATQYPYDPAAAKALLAAAAADGRFDPKKTYKLYAPTTPRPYLPEPERVARFLQAAFENVGFHTELVLQSYPLHRKAAEAGETDLCLFGWIGDTGDPDNFLYVLFDSDNAHPGDAQNMAFYKQPRVDELLAQAQATADQATRSQLYAEVQDDLASDAPWVPLAHSDLVIAGRAEVLGVVVSPLGHPVYALMHRAEK